MSLLPNSDIRAASETHLAHFSSPNTVTITRPSSSSSSSPSPLIISLNNSGDDDAAGSFSVVRAMQWGGDFSSSSSHKDTEKLFIATEKKSLYVLTFPLSASPRLISKLLIHTPEDVVYIANSCGDVTICMTKNNSFFALSFIDKNKDIVIIPLRSSLRSKPVSIYMISKETCSLLVVVYRTKIEVYVVDLVQKELHLQSSTALSYPLLAFHRERDELEILVQRNTQNVDSPSSFSLSPASSSSDMISLVRTRLSTHSPGFQHVLPGEALLETLRVEDNCDTEEAVSENVLESLMHLTSPAPLIAATSEPTIPVHFHLEKYCFSNENNSFLRDDTSRAINLNSSISWDVMLCWRCESRKEEKEEDGNYVAFASSKHSEVHIFLISSSSSSSSPALVLKHTLPDQARHVEVSISSFVN